MSKAEESMAVDVPSTTTQFVPEELYSSFKALLGGKIEWIQQLQAEVPRQVTSYWIMRIRKGKRVIRVIITAAEVGRPCPNDLLMWDYLNDFFEAEEIRARRKNQTLVLPKYEGD